MKAKVRLIKKEDRKGPAAPIAEEAAPDPKEWSTSVKSWVKESQKDWLEGPLEAFDNLFGEPVP